MRIWSSMSHFTSLDVLVNDFFFENSIPKHLPIDYTEMRIEIQIHTTELSMIESNGRAYWEGKGGLRERMNIGRERAHRSNKFMLSWCTTQYTRWFTSEAGDWEREHVIICIHTCTGTQLTSHVYPSACSEQADGTAWILLQHYKRLAGWLVFHCI